MEFRLFMLSAMYENGGNTVHRFLDGHPQMCVYPFESQLGTHLVQDHLAAMFPVNYRWPVFDLAATPAQDYKAIIDEECKIRARTPRVSKFRHIPFDFSDDERSDLFVNYATQSERSRGGNVEAFFRATFDAWKDYRRSGEEQCYVGYSPIIAVDADKILRDLPHAHVLHVVRNPWSAFADTKKRPVPMSLQRYLTAWVITQYYALAYSRLNPDRVHLVRFEDVVADPQGTLGKVCSTLGLQASDSLQKPTWNGAALEEVYPWGTIRKASPEANKATADELSKAEIEAVRVWAQPYLETFKYEGFI